MSAFNANRAVPLGSVSVFAVVTVFERAYDAFVAWRRARATEKALSELSDKQLADIGLARGDIGEVAESLAHR